MASTSEKGHAKNIANANLLNTYIVQLSAIYNPSNPKLLLTKKPTEIITMAVSGMLPKNKLGDALRRNVYVYAGAEHPHSAQQPKEIKLNTIK